MAKGYVRRSHPRPIDNSHYDEHLLFFYVIDGISILCSDGKAMIGGMIEFTFYNCILCFYPHKSGWRDPTTLVANINI